MKLSIIVPVYNVERYVERCLRSILFQGVAASDYEIIIQNDGSTDGSLAVVERVVSGHDNCLVLCSSNRGQSAARNAAFCYAKGEYVWFVDSDDWIEEGCLAALLAEIDKSHADLYNFGYKSSLNNKISVSAMPVTDMGLVGVWGHLYKRNFLIENGLAFVDGIAHEDFEFSPRVAFLAKTIVNLDMAPYIVYKRPNSITTSANPKKAFDMLIVVRSLADFQNKHAQEGCDFTELIAQGLNNSLQTMNMFHFPKDVERELDKAFLCNKDLLVCLWKSKRMKYKMEYILFSLMPNHYVGVFKFLKKFSKRNVDMESVTNRVIIFEENWGGA